jgi:hypothetical protein
MIPSLNSAVLVNVLCALKEGNIRHCEALGFTYDELDAINGLSLDALFSLSRTSAQFIGISIQHDVLRQLIAEVEQDVILKQHIRRAISLGGSIDLLSQFFGLSSGEISARRRLQGVTISQGRTAIPDEETDAKIWRRWQQLRPEKLWSIEALVAMMNITGELQAQSPSTEDLSLTVVWNRIMQCEKDREGAASGRN